MAPKRSTCIGRFVLGERLGAGAMGEVWSAHDPELDRRVAIKRIRGSGDAERRARLVREAQALARLSHPNVVQVFEVGTEGDEVYVAMEQVDGGTLRTWLNAPRSRAAILAVFEQAGRGLAAAHAAGLVHRDFKPDNVLIGSDGRARVVDFGLARAAAVDEAPAPSTHDSDPLHASLTSTGDVLGTPGYMAPEQFTGDPVDARSDQFAFCVALFEALYGVRPFAGATRMALAHAITTGEIVTAPERDVPSWLHRELVRGLAVDPTARHADMNAVLAAISADPHRRRRRILGAAALAIGVVAVPAWVVSRESTAAEPCAASSTALHDAWGAEEKRAFVRELEARGIARMPIDTAVASLDAYADAWTMAHRETCEATHVHRTQSDELLDLEMTCLARRRTALAATIDVLEAATPEVLANAQAIVAGLPAVRSCADDGYVGARAPIEDPQLAADVEAIREDVARTHALLAAGSSLEALDTAKTTREHAATVNHPDALAEALHATGLALRDAGEPKDAATTLEEGYWVAHAAGNDDMAYLLATALVETIGHELRDDAGSQPWIREATALASRATIDPGRRWQLHVDAGIVHWTHARMADAEREFDAALVALGDVDANDPRRSKIVTNLGAVALAKGELPHAHYLFMRSLVADASRVGTEHLVVAESYGNLGVVAFHGGDAAMARAWFERAHAVRRAHLGDGHPHTLAIMGNLAAALLQSGEHDAGIAMLRAQIELWDARPGGHPNAHASRYNLAIALSEVGRHADALEPATTAAIALGDQLGAEHPQAKDASELVEELLALVHTDAISTVQRVRATVTDDASLLARFDAWLAKHSSGTTPPP